jgi:hypothetical protein
MLTGQATKRIMLPFPVLYGLLEGDPSAGQLKSKIAWLSQPLKPNMLLSHVLFRKESGSGSLLINFTLTVHHHSSSPLTTMAPSLSQSTTPITARPNTLTSIIISFAPSVRKSGPVILA